MIACRRPCAKKWRRPAVTGEALPAPLLLAGGTDHGHIRHRQIAGFLDALDDRAEVLGREPSPELAVGVRGAA